MSKVQITYTPEEVELIIKAHIKKQYNISKPAIYRTIPDPSVKIDLQWTDNKGICASIGGSEPYVETFSADGED